MRLETKETTMFRYARLAVMVFAWLALVPAAAYAQASLTGTVRDVSGGVLPPA